MKFPVPPALSRRRWLHQLTMGMSSMALTDLLGAAGPKSGAASPFAGNRVGGLPHLPHHAPKAKRVIFLYMSGGITQFESFDYKPELAKRQGQQLPDSLRKGAMLLGMSKNQASVPLVPSFVPFKQHGKSGAWISDAFPFTAKIADELCFIKSMQSDAVNHDPAMAFMNTGSQIPGRPSMGAWVSYGLGNETADLPSFVVLVSKRGVDQPLSSRCWDAAFLPSQFQGVQFRSGKEPVLYLNTPEGISQESNRVMLDSLKEMNQLQKAAQPLLEADFDAKIEQYEMAFRMQQSVPEATDLAQEPASTFEKYGPDARTPGSFAYNCILARRLAERGVRFQQLFHPGWDMHGNITGSFMNQAAEVDQPAAALVSDLKDRGLLEETLVIFGTEFGRTCYSQGRITKNPHNYGREHHRDCFTFWMAGGGIKGGISYGETDELGYSVVKDPVHVNDFHATMLHLLGIEHERFTFRFQGRDYRLTDLAGRVVQEILT